MTGPPDRIHISMCDNVLMLIYVIYAPINAPKNGGQEFQRRIPKRVRSN